MLYERIIKTGAPIGDISVFIGREKIAAKNPMLGVFGTLEGLRPPDVQLERAEPQARMLKTKSFWCPLFYRSISFAEARPRSGTHVERMSLGNKLCRTCG